MNMPEPCILDTNVFNRIVEESVRLDGIPGCAEFYATHVQLDELRATPQDNPKREKLLAAFQQVGPHLLPTESFCWDVSRFDNAKWSDGQLFKSLKASLDAKKKRTSNTQDALIAEVAIVQGLTLVTADKNLAETAREHGAKVQQIA
jgi:predicted nucleic acid-binding protein